MVVFGKPLAKLCMIGNKFSMYEGILMCYLDHIVLDLGIVIEFYEFNHYIALTQSRCKLVKGL